MHSTLSPSKFILVRQDTQRSSVPSELSGDKQLFTLQSESQQKTNQLLSKTLQYLNKSHELPTFVKKIFVSKSRRNTFLEQIDQKRQSQKAQHLLQAKCKKAFDIGDFTVINPLKLTQNSQAKQQKQNLAGVKSKSRKKQKSNLNQTAKSLSKIQILSNLQKQQTIAEQNYDNENYLFLNDKKVGESESDMQEEPYLYPSQVPFWPKLKFQKSFAPEKTGFCAIRPKVRSMSKYDRDRQQSMEKSMDYRDGNGRYGLKQSRGNGETTPFIKLLPVVPINNQNISERDSCSFIFSGLKSVLGPNSKLGPRLQSIGSKSSLKDQQLLSLQVRRITTFYQKSTQSSESQQCLYTLLSNISKQRNKDAIRIYKDDFAKIYTHRYGRDKITSFFDYEYIEDYGSLLRMFTETVLQFKPQEVMLMSFMLLDFDNDGLISHSDLFKLLTMLDKNLLVKRTIYTILKYVKQNANNQAIRDVCYQEYLRKQNYTLKKYQFMVYMQDKKKGHKEDGSTSNEPKSSSPKIQQTKRTQRKSTDRQQHQSPFGRFFSLRGDTQQTNRQFMYLKAFLQTVTKASQPGAGHFWINFERFKSLYPSSVPQVYYDMLYAAFGLKLPGKQYDELEYESVLAKPKKVTQVQEVRRMDVIEEKMRNMRATRRDLNAKLYKPDIKRHRRIKSLMD